MSLRPVLLFTITVLAASLGAFGCRRTDDSALRVIRVWSHQGQEAENLAMRAIADAFNTAHAAENLRVELTFFPDFQYTEKISIAAAARDLPDAFDVDGPLLARYVDAGLLAPLDPWIDADTLADFLPTIRAQGTIDGQLYALGAFDSAVVLYYDRAMLAAAGVTPPATDAGWTWAEFLDACARLQTAGLEPVGLHMNESADEWYTYAFSPVIWSGGGALIAPDGHTVRGILSSPENILSLQQWQQLFARGFAATDPVDPDPFGHGKVAMDWTGHWMARSHRETKGDRLGAMPLPRVGPQAAAPSGSWCWGVSARTDDPALAARWVKWVTDPRHGIAPIVRANGAVPARRSAFAFFPEYETPPYRLFRTQLETVARSRPRTPHYATLTRHFAQALRDISRGADVATRLRAAEAEIQREIDRSGRAAPEHPTPNTQRPTSNKSPPTSSAGLRPASPFGLPTLKSLSPPSAATSALNVKRSTFSVPPPSSPSALDVQYSTLDVRRPRPALSSVFSVCSVGPNPFFPHLLRLTSTFRVPPPSSPSKLDVRSSTLDVRRSRAASSVGQNPFVSRLRSAPPHTSAFNVKRSTFSVPPFPVPPPSSPSKLDVRCSMLDVRPRLRRGRRRR